MGSIFLHKFQVLQSQDIDVACRITEDYKSSRRVKLAHPCYKFEHLCCLSNSAKRHIYLMRAHDTFSFEINRPNHRVLGTSHNQLLVWVDSKIYYLLQILRISLKKFSNFTWSIVSRSSFFLQSYFFILSLNRQQQTSPKNYILPPE